MDQDTEVTGAATASEAAQASQPATNNSDQPTDIAGLRLVILRRIVEWSEPAEYADGWSFLAPSHAIRSFSYEPAELLRLFQQEFSIIQLVAAGVLVAGAGGGEQLVVALRQAKFQLLLDADRQIIDLATDAGRLFGDDPPCFELFQRWPQQVASPSDSLVELSNESPLDSVDIDLAGDSELVEPVETDRGENGESVSEPSEDYGSFLESDLAGLWYHWVKPHKLLAASIDDVQILHGLGMSCTLATGLATLDSQQLQRLLGTESPLLSPPKQAVLVGIQVATLQCELPDGMAPVLEHLAAASEIYGCEDGNVVDPCMGLWTPSTKLWGRIRAAVRFQDREMTRQLIQDSIWQFDRPKSISAAWRREQTSKSTDIQYWRSEYQAAQDMPPSHSGEPAWKRPQAKLEEALNRVTTQRFLEAAQSTKNPVASSALLVMGELMERSNGRHSVLSAKRGSRYSPPDALSLESNDRIEELGKTVRLIRSLTPLLDR